MTPLPTAMNALLRPVSSLALVAAVAATLAASPAVHAQAAKPAAPAATPAPAAPIDAEKQKQIDRILAVLHPENGVLQAVQQQGVKAMQQSSIALQTNQVPQERKDKALKEIQADVQKYIDTTMPVAVASAKKFSGPVSAPILAANFSTDELRQLAVILESPLRDKLEKIMPQLQDAVGQKVSADIGPTVNKNGQVMMDAVSSKLRVAVTLK